MDIEHNITEGTSPTVDVKNDLIPKLRNMGHEENKLGSLTLFIITLIIFFSAQIISVKWQEILILIGALLFHELGHFGAMKLFKYDDAKIFFIPFLGAAVSGKSRKDTAVKSCIVSLMGPLPGIVLGLLLYFLFQFTKSYYMFKAAQVMLILNVFNLLPIMPLDGGRFVDVLFVNRRYFRLLFAFIGAAIFLFLAVYLRDFVLGLVGFFSVYMALSSFKLHGISNNMKSQGIYAASVSELVENENSMQIIIEKLQKEYPKLFKPKVIYKAIFNHLTGIVDTIKFIPARLLSKITLLVSYVVVVLISLYLALSFLALGYRETVRIEKNNGKQYTYAEHHMFGQKWAECPINQDQLYDGKGIAFGPDKTSIAEIFYYSNGYRTGEWLKFDETGKPIEKKTYNGGQLLSLSRLEEGQWNTYPYQDLSFFRKCIEEVQRIAQPYKSNYKHFQQ